MSDGPSVGDPPATTIELQSALPNRVLGGGVCKALPRLPSSRPRSLHLIRITKVHWTFYMSSSALTGAPAVQFCCAP